MTVFLRRYFFFEIGEAKVRAYMKHLGIKAVKHLKKSFNYSLNPKASKFDNKIRNITITRKNQLWTSDITFKKTKRRMVYICVIRDAYHGGIIACKKYRSFTYDMLNALVERLLILNNVEPGTLTFHSDHGAQYTSNSFIDLLSKYGVIQSMSEMGCPEQNQLTEQVFSHMKRDLIDPKNLDSEEEFEFKLNVWVTLKNFLPWSIYKKAKMDYKTDNKFIMVDNVNNNNISLR